MSSQVPDDRELQRVAEAIKKIDPDGSRSASVLRCTIDQLYDGQRTGRYKWDQLFKTEKTHCGTLVEINFQREFEFADGESMDFQIAGVDVDCKYSQKFGGWMIPPEAISHLCLVGWAEDSRNPRWSLGLVRITPSILNDGGNRDGKKTISADNRRSIYWLWKDAPLQPNVLIQADSTIVKKIFSHSSGMQRINELFRLLQGVIVSRNVVATVNQGDDYMKRVRANGGARTHLKPEGIVILGQYKSHAQIASDLGLPIPKRGESLSIRVTPALVDEFGSANFGNSFWRVANENDPVVSAPDHPCV